MTRPRRLSRTSCRAGVTLLELLLAVSVLALVAAMVLTGVDSSLRVVEQTREGEAVYRRAQVALERIAEDLAAAVLDEDVDFIGARDSQNGEAADSLRFTSMAHIVFDPENDGPGLAYITYTVARDEEDGRLLVLLRGDQRLGPVEREHDRREQPEDPPGLVLSDRLRSVRFTYFDAEGNEEEEWDTASQAEDKDEERRLPAVVTCTLEYWLDVEAETSIRFTTSAALPAGLIRPEKQP